MSVWDCCQCGPGSWKLIAAAPTDGTEILLQNFTGTIMQGYWDGARWLVSSSGTPFPDPVRWQAVPDMEPPDWAVPVRPSTCL